MSDSEPDLEGGGEGIDPENLDKLSEKERKKWEKNLEKWRVFMDFIVRHVAIATFKYNSFELEEMGAFLDAMDRAEKVRSSTKLKKGEVAKITSFKVMRDTTDLLVEQRYLAEANRIRKFLDIAGRMRGISMIAMGFFKAMKKGNVKGVDKIKYYLEYWKGFCLRSFDYSELTFKGAEVDKFTPGEKQYRVWPTVVRTSINLSQKFLKKSSDSTGLELIPSDPKTIQKHMQAAEFVVAAKIEDMLFTKVVQDSKSFLIGGSPLLNTNTPSSASVDSKPPKWDMPSLEDIHPDLIKPIPDNGLLLNLPEDPPKDKKKGKKKKGGKKGGRSASASSHRGGKKKKKK